MLAISSDFTTFFGRGLGFHRNVRGPSTSDRSLLGFDDFDLDYNKYTYLYETRLSGALVNPLSAMAIELVTAKTA